MLQFDYDEVHGQTVTGIVGSRCESGRWEAIAVLVEDRSVVLRVDPATDEVIVTLEQARDANGWDAVTEIPDVAGSELGWCWVGRNFRG